MHAGSDKLPLGNICCAIKDVNLIHTVGDQPIIHEARNTRTSNNHKARSLLIACRI